jgi:hypothetical protein
MRRIRELNRSRTADPEVTALDRVLLTVIEGRVHRVLPPDQLPDYERFIWQEAVPAGRYALAFPVACGCLGWLGFTIERADHTPRGFMVRSHAAAARIPDHEGRACGRPDLEPPAELAAWPRWLLDIPDLAARMPGSGKPNL